MEKHRDKTRARMQTFVVCMVTLFVISYTQAARIYKSIDAEGNVTYSATPPDDAAQIEKIIIPADYDADPATADNLMFLQIQAAAAELENDRKQREAARETAQQKLLEEEAAKQVQKPPEPVIYYYPVYPPTYFHSHRSRPPHPQQPPPRPPRKQSPESHSFPEKPG